MTRDYPYTGSDLRDIAEKVETVTDALGPERWGLTVDIYDDGGELAGQIKPYGDGWLGFYPKAVGS